MKEVLKEVQWNHVLSFKEKLYWTKLYFSHELGLKTSKEDYEETLNSIKDGNNWVGMTFVVTVLIIAVAAFCFVVTNFVETLKAIILLPLWLLAIVALCALLVFVSAFFFKTPKNLIIFFFAYKFERGTLERVMNPTTNKAEIIVHAPDCNYQSEYYPRRFFEIHHPEVVIATNKLNPSQQYLFNAEYQVAQKYDESLPLKKF